MGYVTNFEISARVNNVDIDDSILTDIISDATGVNWFKCSYHGKWYTHEEDMIKLSKKYPDYAFEINGVGEEYPDIWRLYAKNGKIKKVQAIISFPPVELEYMI